jgi:hypothetical protein
MAPVLDAVIEDNQQKQHRLSDEDHLDHEIAAKQRTTTYDWPAPKGRGRWRSVSLPALVGRERHPKPPFVISACR